MLILTKLVQMVDFHGNKVMEEHQVITFLNKNVLEINFLGVFWIAEIMFSSKVVWMHWNCCLFLFNFSSSISKIHVYQKLNWFLSWNFQIKTVFFNFITDFWVIIIWVNSKHNFGYYKLLWTKVTQVKSGKVELKKTAKEYKLSLVVNFPFTSFFKFSFIYSVSNLSFIFTVLNLFSLLKKNYFTFVISNFSFILVFQFFLFLQNFSLYFFEFYFR